MQKYQLGDKVSFRLDSRTYGEGIIKNCWGHSYEVELTNPCKEFESGVMIIVSVNEIVKE